MELTWYGPDPMIGRLLILSDVNGSGEGEGRPKPDLIKEIVLLDLT